MSANDMIDDDTFIFADHDDDADIEELEPTNGHWLILIVDDEPEIHKVTELALANIQVANKSLEFLHAYSGEEAISVLRDNPEVAVILLDVVMESDDAGLLTVGKIRQELHLTDVRIILRTGQPGYAPEEQVVMEYDINDYKTKTELTRNKLLTSVFSAIRSFQQLQTISKSRDFLQTLNQLNRQLLAQTDLNKFVEVLVKESCGLFHAEQGLMLLDQFPEQTEQGYWVINGSGGYQDMIGQRYENCLSGRMMMLVDKAKQSSSHQFEEDCSLIYIEAQSCRAMLLLDTLDTLNIADEFLQVYVDNIASDLDNSLLIEKVTDLAFKDGLTKLPNRTRFIQLLDELTNNRLDADYVMLLDVDHFSDINDGLGQEVGNTVLRAVAERLLTKLPSQVSVCRLGADIFGLVGKREDLVPEVVMSLFKTPVKAGEHSIPLNVTLGVCEKLVTDKMGLAVLKHANIALNRAKRDSHRKCHVYRSEMEDETSWRLGMIRRLNADFKANKLQVWYQPQINVESETFIGMEALLRWPDGEGGFISPVTFIPLAEYSGLIIDIGAWVLEQSCIQIKQLHQSGFENFRVAVNVSMPQFRSAGFVERVIATAKRYEIEPKFIELEITESVVMDEPSLVIDVLKSLKENGFTIAIDDFGTGFSSLSYLHKLPLDRLKVDREFIKDIGDGGDGIIAETVIHLGHKLGLETIAEGIENEFQLNYVKELGCTEAQGFYHAKPMPGDQLQTFLSQK